MQNRLHKNGHCHITLLLKETPLRSGRVTRLKRKFSKTCFFLLLTCEGHGSLSCGTLICLLSIGNLFKTCIISVDLGKTLVTFFPVQQIHSNFNRVAKSIEDILRYHKISFDTLNSKYVGIKNK